MSHFWNRLRRGRCSIGIVLMKSTRFLLAFVNSAMVDEKSESFAAVSRFLHISLRDSYAASVKKELLFFQSKESLQETTSFKLSD